MGRRLLIFSVVLVATITLRRILTTGALSGARHQNVKPRAKHEGADHKQQQSQQTDQDTVARLTPVDDHKPHANQHGRQEKGPPMSIWQKLEPPSVVLGAIIG